MSPSASVSLPSTPTSASSTRRPSLLAKWNRDARLSISSSKSAISRVNVLISPPFSLGSVNSHSTGGVGAPRRDSLIPKSSNGTSRKRSHKEVIPNENLDIDAQDRSRTRQRTDSETTIKASSYSSPTATRRDADAKPSRPTPIARDGDVPTPVQTTTRPGQALKALKDRLRRASAVKTSTREGTEVAVAHGDVFNSSGNLGKMDTVSPRELTDLAQSVQTQASQGLAVKLERPVARNEEQANKSSRLEGTSRDLVISQPRRLRRTAASYHLFSESAQTPASSSGPVCDTVQSAILKNDSKLKALAMPMPLQPRNANTLHASSSALLAVGGKDTLVAGLGTSDSVKKELLRRHTLFKAVSLKPDELSLAIAFYDTPHFEIWDVRDDICLAWPAELRLKVVDPLRYDLTSLHTPEVSRIALRCHSKSYCEDPEHQHPFALCESDSWYDVEFTGAICREERTSTMIPEAGIHISTDWTRTYARRVNPDAKTEPSEAESSVVRRGRKSSSARVPLPTPRDRGWAMKFWIPIPTHLFVKRETRSFIIESRVWLEEDARDLSYDEKAFTATAEMTISHLKREREML